MRPLEDCQAGWHERLGLVAITHVPSGGVWITEQPANPCGTGALKTCLFYKCQQARGQENQMAGKYVHLIAFGCQREPVIYISGGIPELSQISQHESRAPVRSDLEWGHDSSEPQAPGLETGTCTIGFYEAERDDDDDDDDGECVCVCVHAHAHAEISVGRV